MTGGGDAARVETLEARLRELEAENAVLAERQEDASLIGLVAEAAHLHDGPDAILAAGLERLSVLRDLPLCGRCELHPGGARVTHLYAASSPDPPRERDLRLSARVARELEAGAVLLEGASACEELGLRDGTPCPGFVPGAALAISCEGRGLSRGFFVFAVREDARRLASAALVLHRAVDVLVARLDTLALVQELRGMAETLDAHVAERTCELRRSEERLRLALEVAGAFAWELDLATGALHVDGLPGFRCKAALEELVPPDDRPLVERELAALATEGGRRRFEHRLRRADGTTGWVEAVGRAYPCPDGRSKRLVGVTLDVTERRRLEEDLRQAQRLESIGRLAGGVAHDFNNLLTTILGVSEVLLAETPPGAAMAEDLRAVRDAGRHAAQLTRQLLAFSRKQRLDIRVVDLDGVCVAFAPILARLLGEDVRLDVRPGAAGAAILADRAQVEQILLNLAANARDAMPGGGTLTVETSLVRAASGPRVRLVVADTGAGMAPDVAARAFEPFFTTKGPGKGTGLGLASVYGIVDQHGGTVALRTAPGEGTRVEIELPLAARAAASKPRAPEPPPVGRGEAVLVVDDEAGVRRLIRRALERIGYEVVDAADGPAALAALDGGLAPHLLLTDVVMPGMRGPELAAAFRARHPGRPVLFMSGYADGLPGGDAGALIEKPIAPDALARAVRSALDAAEGAGAG